MRNNLKIAFMLFWVLTPTNKAFSEGNPKVYHTVTISAPSMQGEKVQLKGIRIMNGSATGLASKITSNGKDYYRTQGGGLNISGSEVELMDCEISGNEASLAGGVYINNRSVVSFDRCNIHSNSSTGNTGGIVTTGNSLLTMNECNISNNQSAGIASALQVQNSKSNVYNSTISNNKANGNIGGCYLREGSENYWVNCTIYGNETNGYGGGLAIYGTATSKTNAQLISSTISSNRSATTGGGINIVNTNGTLNIHNSIISGNLGSNEVNGAVNKSYSIIENRVYNGSGTEIPGSIFDVTTMLDEIKDNGGKTATCLLLQVDNPAFVQGMTTDQLTSLANSFAIPIPNEVIIKDQIKNLRSGKNCMGSVSLVKISSTINQIKQVLDINIKVINGKLVIRSIEGERITIFDITGRTNQSWMGNGDWMEINNLSKGVYIIKKHNQSIKIII